MPTQTNNSFNGQEQTKVASGNGSNLADTSIGVISPTITTEANASFLRAARAGNLEKVLEYLRENIDINVSNSNGLNALHLASKEGHVNVVKELLERNAFVDAATKKGNTALHIASLAGQQAVVELLVKHGANVDCRSQNGFTPLYMAAQENHVEVVKFLLANNANQSLATEDGFTPLAVALQQGHEKVVAILLENDSRGKIRLPALHIAAKKNDVKAAALLLNNDPNMDLSPESGFTPLHIAAHYGNVEIAKFLISKGADVNFEARQNITPLHVATKWGKANSVNLLLDNGAKIDAKTRDGLTPLHCAARSGHEQIVELLFSRNAPINAKTKNGLTALHMAAQGDHVDAARILLYHSPKLVDQTTCDYLTALHVAAHCGHVKIAKLLLDHKADVNSRALNGFTPLHIACKKNRIKVVELLIKHGASKEATTESGLTPLHVASFMGCMNVVVFLIQHGSQPNVPTIRGETPLHLAARANQTDIVRILLRHGATVDAKAKEQQTPLHIATRLGNTDIIALLLRHGAFVDAATSDGYTALHIASKEGQEEVASILFENGASLNVVTKKGFTPLHIASKYGNVKVASLLLQRQAQPDIQGKNGLTPLHVATHYNRPSVAHLLLEHGASPHIIAKNGYSALHIAAKKNQIDIATTLLEYQAKTNCESNAGFTPLHLACQEGHIDMSSLLLEHDADPNSSSKNGLTPLHLCAQEDKVNCAAVLVKRGATIDPQTKAGYTPLHVACHFGQINMVKFLLQHSADVNIVTKHGFTSLHCAAQQGHVLIVKLLLENGASPDVINNNGQTPLAIAQRLGYISVIEELKLVTQTTLVQTTIKTTEEKYKVQTPETMQETFMSDSEDELGDEAMFGDAEHYKYLTNEADLNNVGDDSMALTPKTPKKEETKLVATSPISPDDALLASQQQQLQQQLQQQQPPQQHSPAPPAFTSPDNVPINEQGRPGDKLTTSASGKKIAVTGGSVGNISTESLDGSYYGYYNNKNLLEADNIPVEARPKQTGFLISFMVDARGGAMKGCRHSGVRVIIPPRRASMPTRITCRFVRREKLLTPPPLNESEALAARILEMGPQGCKFLGPVILEIPHYASLRGKEREIMILRSDLGEKWYEHPIVATESAIEEALGYTLEMGGVIEDGTSTNATGHNEDTLSTTSAKLRITRIITTDFPKYFALVSRVRHETHAVSEVGGVISSTIVPKAQAVFPEKALQKKIKLSLQAMPIPYDLVAKMFGNRVAVSPIVTIEPRRRKFHKAITLTIPLPKSPIKGMMNNYSHNNDAYSLRLLCSITGGLAPAQWEDITGHTPLSYIDECVSFTTTVSARFWLMDCQNVSEATRMATELYREAIAVPFMSRFVVYAKRYDLAEAKLRVYCITDDKEEKTLEQRENFMIVAKSKEVEVLDSRVQWLEMGGNIVPVTKSNGEQLSLNFAAFVENRLPFTVRIKDIDQTPPVGRLVFLKDPKNAQIKSDVRQPPVCTLDLQLPPFNKEVIEYDENRKKATLERERGLQFLYFNESGSISSAARSTNLLYTNPADAHVEFNLRLLANDLNNSEKPFDWLTLATLLELSNEEVDMIRHSSSSSPLLLSASPANQTHDMLVYWTNKHNRAIENVDQAPSSGDVLLKALRDLNVDEEVINRNISSSYSSITNINNIEKAIAQIKLTSTQSNDDNQKHIHLSAYEERDLTKESESAEVSDSDELKGARNETNGNGKMTTGIFKIVEEIHNVYDESQSPHERRQPREQTRTIHTDVITAAATTTTSDVDAYGQFTPSEFHAQTIITTVTQSNNDDGSMNQSETVEEIKRDYTSSSMSQDEQGRYDTDEAEGAPFKLRLAEPLRVKPDEHALGHPHNDEYYSKINTEYEAIKRDVLSRLSPAKTLPAPAVTAVAAAPAVESSPSRNIEQDARELVKGVQEAALAIVNQPTQEPKMPQEEGLVVHTATSVSQPVPLNASYYDNLNNINNELAIASVARRISVEKIEATLTTTSELAENAPITHIEASIVNESSLSSANAREKETMEMIQLIESITSNMEQIAAESSLAGSVSGQAAFDETVSTNDDSNLINEELVASLLDDSQLPKLNASSMLSQSGNMDIINDIILQVMEAQNQTENLEKIELLTQNIEAIEILSSPKHEASPDLPANLAAEISSIILPKTRDEDTSALEVSIDPNENDLIDSEYVVVDGNSDQLKSIIDEIQEAVSGSENLVEKLGEGLINAGEGPLTPQPSPEESCQNVESEIAESAMASETEQLVGRQEDQEEPEQELAEATRTQSQINAYQAEQEQQHDFEQPDNSDDKCERSNSESESNSRSGDKNKLALDLDRDYDENDKQFRFKLDENSRVIESIEQQSPIIERELLTTEHELENLKSRLAMSETVSAVTQSVLESIRKEYNLPESAEKEDDEQPARFESKLEEYVHETDDQAEEENEEEALNQNSSSNEEVEFYKKDEEAEEDTGASSHEHEPLMSDNELVDLLTHVDAGIKEHVDLTQKLISRKSISEAAAAQVEVKAEPVAQTSEALAKESEAQLKKIMMVHNLDDNEILGEEIDSDQEQEALLGGQVEEPESKEVVVVDPYLSSSASDNLIRDEEAQTEAKSTIGAELFPQSVRKLSISQTNLLDESESDSNNEIPAKEEEPVKKADSFEKRDEPASKLVDDEETDKFKSVNIASTTRYQTFDSSSSTNSELNKQEEYQEQELSRMAILEHDHEPEPEEKVEPESRASAAARLTSSSKASSVGQEESEQLLEASSSSKFDEASKLNTNLLLVTQVAGISESREYLLDAAEPAGEVEAEKMVLQDSSASSSDEYVQEKEIARSLIGNVISESRKQVAAEEVTQASQEATASTISSSDQAPIGVADHLSTASSKRPSYSYTPVQLTPTADPLGDESIDDISITTVIERKFSDSSNKQRFDPADASPLIQVEESSKLVSDLVYSSEDESQQRATAAAAAKAANMSEVKTSMFLELNKTLKNSESTQPLVELLDAPFEPNEEVSLEEDKVSLDRARYDAESPVYQNSSSSNFSSTSEENILNDDKDEIQRTTSTGMINKATEILNSLQTQNVSKSLSYLASLVVSPSSNTIVEDSKKDLEEQDAETTKIGDDDDDYSSRLIDSTICEAKIVDDGENKRAPVKASQSLNLQGGGKMTRPSMFNSKSNQFEILSAIDLDSMEAEALILQRQQIEQILQEQQTPTPVENIVGSFFDHRVTSSNEPSIDHLASSDLNDFPPSATGANRTAGERIVSDVDSSDNLQSILNQERVIEETINKQVAQLADNTDGEIEEVAAAVATALMFSSTLKSQSSDEFKFQQTDLNSSGEQIDGKSSVREVSLAEEKETSPVEADLLDDESNPELNQAFLETEQEPARVSIQTAPASKKYIVLSAGQQQQQDESISSEDNTTMSESSDFVHPLGAQKSSLVPDDEDEPAGIENPAFEEDSDEQKPVAPFSSSSSDDIQPPQESKIHIIQSSLPSKSIVLNPKEPSGTTEDSDEKSFNISDDSFDAFTSRVGDNFPMSDSNLEEVKEAPAPDEDPAVYAKDEQPTHEEAREFDGELIELEKQYDIVDSTGDEEAVEPELSGAGEDRKPSDFLELDDRAFLICTPSNQTPQNERETQGASPRVEVEEAERPAIDPEETTELAKTIVKNALSRSVQMLQEQEDELKDYEFVSAKQEEEEEKAGEILLSETEGDGKNSQEKETLNESSLEEFTDSSLKEESIEEIIKREDLQSMILSQNCETTFTQMNVAAVEEEQAKEEAVEPSVEPSKRISMIEEGKEPSEDRADEAKQAYLSKHDSCKEDEKPTKKDDDDEESDGEDKPSRGGERASPVQSSSLSQPSSTEPTGSNQEKPQDEEVSDSSSKIENEEEQDASKLVEAKSLVDRVIEKACSIVQDQVTVESSSVDRRKSSPQTSDLLGVDQGDLATRMDRFESRDIIKESESCELIEAIGRATEARKQLERESESEGSFEKPSDSSEVSVILAKRGDQDQAPQAEASSLNQSLVDAELESTSSNEIKSQKSVELAEEKKDEEFYPNKDEACKPPEKPKRKDNDDDDDEDKPSRGGERASPVLSSQPQSSTTTRASESGVGVSSQQEAEKPSDACQEPSQLEEREEELIYSVTTYYRSSEPIEDELPVRESVEEMPSEDAEADTTIAAEAARPDLESMITEDSVEPEARAVEMEVSAVVAAEEVTNNPLMTSSMISDETEANESFVTMAENTEGSLSMISAREELNESEDRLSNKTLEFNASFAAAENANVSVDEKPEEIKSSMSSSSSYHTVASTLPKPSDESPEGEKTAIGTHLPHRSVTSSSNYMTAVDEFGSNGGHSSTHNVSKSESFYSAIESNNGGGNNTSSVYSCGVSTASSLNDASFNNSFSTGKENWSSQSNTDVEDGNLTDMDTDADMDTTLEEHHLEGETSLGGAEKPDKDSMGQFNVEYFLKNMYPMIQPESDLQSKKMTAETSSHSTITEDDRGDADDIKLPRPKSSTPIQSCLALDNAGLVEQEQQPAQQVPSRQNSVTATADLVQESSVKSEGSMLVISESETIETSVVLGKPAETVRTPEASEDANANEPEMIEMPNESPDLIDSPGSKESPIMSTINVNAQESSGNSGNGDNVSYTSSVLEFEKLEMQFSSESLEDKSPNQLGKLDEENVFEMRDEFGEENQNADFDLDQESLPSYKAEFEINHDLNTIYESVEKESSSIDESKENLCPAKEPSPVSSQAELSASPTDQSIPHKQDLVLDISNNNNADVETNQESDAAADQECCTKKPEAAEAIVPETDGSKSESVSRKESVVIEKSRFSASASSSPLQSPSLATVRPRMAQTPDKDSQQQLVKSLSSRSSSSSSVKSTDSFENELKCKFKVDDSSFFARKLREKTTPPPTLFETDVPPSSSDQADPKSPQGQDSHKIMNLMPTSSNIMQLDSGQSSMAESMSSAIHSQLQSPAADLNLSSIKIESSESLSSSTFSSHGGASFSSDLSSACANALQQQNQASLLDSFIADDLMKVSELDVESDEQQAAEEAANKADSDTKIPESVKSPSKTAKPLSAIQAQLGASSRPSRTSSSASSSSSTSIGDSLVLSASKLLQAAQQSSGKPFQTSSIFSAEDLPSFRKSTSPVLFAPSQTTGNMPSMETKQASESDINNKGAKTITNNSSSSSMSAINAGSVVVEPENRPGMSKSQSSHSHHSSNCYCGKQEPNPQRQSTSTVNLSSNKDEPQTSSISAARAENETSFKSDQAN